MEYSQTITQETAADLIQDKMELNVLLQDKITLLQKREQTLKKLDVPEQIIASILNTLFTIKNELENINIHPSDSFNKLMGTYNTFTKLHFMFRNTIQSAASIALAADWQSPSFLSSIQSQAGMQTGNIHQSVNDYKRDQHADGHAYEEAFRREYIEYPFFSPVRIFSTNSGMSALTTIIGFLFEYGNVQNTSVIIGKRSYFENKKIIKTFFHSFLSEVDESDFRAIKDTAVNKKPSVWFFDSLCNNEDIYLPHLETIFGIIRSIPNYHPYVIVDNTFRPIFFQPFSSRIKQPKNLIVWESLLKHHQFGLDKTGGGILYARCHQASELYTLRDHLGTNISDIASLTIPSPNKELLKIRLFRHNRNHICMANGIQDWITKHPHAILARVQSPLFQTEMKEDYIGCIFNLQFIQKYENVRFYKTFLQRCIAQAKKNNVELTGGTSFGFNTTRLYIPASRAGQGTPFFRIAVGTEPRGIIEKVQKTIIDILETYT